MKKGFTLIELVIVIAVIAILAGVLITTFSGVLKSAEDSVYLQTRKNSQTEDAIDEIFETKVLSWNTVEEGLVYAFVKTGSHSGNIKSEQIITEMYTEISDLISNGYSCRVSETYLKTMYNKTIDNKFSDVQIIRLLKDSETDFDDYYDLMRKLNPINNSFEKLNNVFSNSDISKINEKLAFVCDGFSDEEKDSFISHFSEYIRGNIGESANNISINIECDNLLNPSEISINFGEVKLFNVTTSNSNGTENINVEYSNQENIFIFEDKIIGTGNGSSVITVSISDHPEIKRTITVNSSKLLEEDYNVINIDTETPYNSLQTAINEATENQTLLVINDIELDSGLIITSKNNITILGNDKDNQKIITTNKTSFSYLLSISSSRIIINNMIFNGNEKVGGLKAQENSNLSINNCIIKNGKSIFPTDSGGIYINNSNLEICDSQITSNVSSKQGGGIYAVNATNLNINKCIISDNEVTTTSLILAADNNSDYHGGAGIMIYNDVSANLTYNITNTKFLLNMSTTYGGGLYCRLLASSSDLLNLNILNCTFESNTSKRGGGCSFICKYPLTLNVNISNVNFTGNTANNEYYDGGAIFDTLAFVNISENTSFLKNTSNNGSAITLKNTYSGISNTENITYVILNNCTIYTQGENANSNNVIHIYPSSNDNNIVGTYYNPVTEDS